MTEDWNIEAGNDLAALRASGIVRRGNKILLDHVLDTGEYWLPGGHVKIGETTENALKREFQEELTVAISDVHLTSIIENFRHWHGYRTHVVEDSLDISDTPVLTADNDNVEKRWVEVSELSNLTTSPSNLTELLTDLSKNLRHFVSRDR
ncbi:NUDIX domain-containing protein [Lactococcus cremoris]|uniref:NUDIX hydrolase n=1 Tax=Lactococcus lactis subsp. cremoris TaxID=1359 RepID=UPI0021AF3FC0|nr:NUDIX domain-containing protein [Lactococcus cremoris]MCT0497448.1 NUDIX domain-containing protein [Lactococcus cremoris]